MKLSLRALVDKKVKTRANRGGYNPNLPGFGSILEMTAAEYLEAFGSVQDNRTKVRVPFAADTVNGPLTENLLGYIDDPGYDEDGLPYWNLTVSGRQSTKSTAAAYALYTKAAREPGTEAFILADTGDRAKYLFARAKELHDNLPTGVRPPLVDQSGTTRGLTFDPAVGGSLTFYSAERKGGMVGFSGKVGQISEIPFMQDPAKTLSVLLPALYHQTESRLTLESTPAPPTYNGAEYWRRMVLGGLAAGNRFKVHFSPFWESKLNVKTWRDDWKLTNEEVGLLNQFGHLGLRQEHLAFRRSVMSTDEEIRRYPELFDVWYPFTLTTCWGGGAIGLFPSQCLRKHTAAQDPGRHSPAPFENHRRVVIGCDPAGLLGGADHAAFSVLGCDQTDWSLHEVFSANVTVHEYVDELIQTATKYHGLTGKWPDIAVESNGAGAATLALLIERRYPMIYCESRRKPGITASKKANARMVAETIDALMDDLQPLWSLPMVMQLQSYSGDRQKRTSEMSMLINGIAKGRRERQHWDLCSSFMIAVDAARNLPLPRQPYKDKPVHQAIRGYTAADYDKLRAMDNAARKKKKRGKR